MGIHRKIRSGFWRVLARNPLTFYLTENGKNGLRYKGLRVLWADWLSILFLVFSEIFFGPVRCN